MTQQQPAHHPDEPTGTGPNHTRRADSRGVATGSTDPLTGHLTAMHQALLAAWGCCSATLDALARVERISGTVLNRLEEHAAAPTVDGAVGVVRGAETAQFVARELSPWFDRLGELTRTAGLQAGHAGLQLAVSGREPSPCDESLAGDPQGGSEGENKDQHMSSRKHRESPGAEEAWLVPQLLRVITATTETEELLAAAQRALDEMTRTLGEVARTVGLDANQPSLNQWAGSQISQARTLTRAEVMAGFRHLLDASSASVTIICGTTHRPHRPIENDEQAIAQILTTGDRSERHAPRAPRADRNPDGHQPWRGSARRPGPRL